MGMQKTYGKTRNLSAATAMCQLATTDTGL
jgi:hypothetical protein